jgi:hypothetical protein
MATTRGDRLFAATGLLFPLLTVAGFVLFPKPAGDDVSAAHDPAWLHAHTGAAIAQSYVRAFAAVAFIALSVAVARAVREHKQSSVRSKLVVAGGVACGLLMLLAQAVTLSAALAVRASVPSDVVRAFDSLNAGVLSLSSLPAVLLFAAAAAGFARNAEIPRWLTITTALGVPLALVDAASYDGGPLAAVGVVGLAYFLLWSLTTAVQLARRPATDTGALRTASATAPVA